MSYKLKEIQVTLSSGAVVTAEVETIDDARQLLKELGQLGLGETAASVGRTDTRKKTDVTEEDEDSPESRVESRAALPSGCLRSKAILAFKDGIPQLLRPSSFSSVSDASIALLFAVEAGLKKNSLEFDAFKALYESQNIKSGSPVSMLLTNLRNGQYLDAKLYSSERKVRLTAKGETKAIEVLKLMAGASK